MPRLTMLGSGGTTRAERGELRGTRARMSSASPRLIALVRGPAAGTVEGDGLGDGRGIGTRDGVV